MSRIGNLQDFLDAVGPYQPVVAGTPLPETERAPDAPVASDPPPPLPVATDFAPNAEPTVDLDAVTAVTRFPPRG